jgi:hypothetical protein
VPNNKTETQKLPKERKARTSKATPALLDEDEPADTGKPLATIGDHVKAKRDDRKVAREVRLENFTKRLPCQITESENKTKLREIKDLKRQLDHENETLATLKVEYDGAKKSAEARIGQAQSRREQLISETCDGIEYRDVACQRVWDYPLIQVREYRTDRTPNELLQEPRPMNNSDLQMPLNLEPSDLATQGKSFTEATSGSATDDDVDQGEIDW